MTRTVRLFGGVALAMGVIAMTVWGMDRRRTVMELRTLQEDVQATRGSIRSCQSRLAALEASFQDFDTRLSALRERVAALESADGPASYQHLPYEWPEPPEETKWRPDVPAQIFAIREKEPGGQARLMKEYRDEERIEYSGGGR